MDFSNLCKELGVASVGWNSDSYTFGVNEDSEGCVLNFKDFVENMGIVKSENLIQELLKNISQILAIRYIPDYLIMVIGYLIICVLL